MAAQVGASAFGTGPSKGEEGFWLITTEKLGLTERERVVLQRCDLSSFDGRVWL